MPGLALIFLNLIVLFQRASTEDNLDESNSSLITSSLLPVDYGGYRQTHSTMQSSSAGNSSYSNTHAPHPESNGTLPYVDSGTPEPEVDATTLWQYQKAMAILSYGPPALIILATVGNTMSVITLQHPMFRKSSTSFLMSAVALVDLIYIDSGLMRQWILYLFDVDVRSFSSFGCKLHIFLTYFLQMLSAWSLVLLTSERAISVWFPFKCKELCSRRRIAGVWIGMFVALASVNAHFFVTRYLNVVIVSIPETNSTVHVFSCDLVKTYTYFFYQQWYWISAAFQVFIPAGVLFIGNISIVSRIVVANRLRKGQMQATGAKNDKTKGGKVTSSTVTLIVISIVFLLLNVPSEVYFLMLGSDLLKTNTAQEIAIVNLLYSTFIFVSYINNGINFLMYFISGRKFRLAARDTVMCHWGRDGKRPRGESTTGERVIRETGGVTRVSRFEDISMTTASATTKD